MTRILHVAALLSLAHSHRALFKRLFRAGRAVVSRYFRSTSLLSSKYCAGCDVSDDTQRLVMYCGRSSDGKYYCEACWRAFNRGVVPRKRCTDSDNRPIALTQRPRDGKSVIISDIKFPTLHPVFKCHSAQLSRCRSIRLVDGVDAFLPSEALRENHLIDCDVDLMVFSAPHGVLCDGSPSAHLAQMPQNATYILTAFLALCSKTGFSGLVVVPFAQQYRDSIFKAARSVGTSTFGYDFFILPMARIPGWKPRCSNPSRESASLCEEDEVFCLANFMASGDELNLIEVFRSADKVIFFGSFTCALELTLINADCS